MQKTGEEQLTFQDKRVGYNLRDFWAWRFSDPLDNTLRGHFSEFLVATALEMDVSGVNSDWHPYDLLFHFEGKSIRIEVKSAAYLQSWVQNKLSEIQYSIRPTRAWSPETGYEEKSVRQSDIYVFCLYKETVRDYADPLNLDGWDFYIVPTSILDDQCGEQKSIRLTKLMSLQPVKADYGTLKYKMEELIRTKLF